MCCTDSGASLHSLQLGFLSGEVEPRPLSIFWAKAFSVLPWSVSLCCPETSLLQPLECFLFISQFLYVLMLHPVQGLVLSWHSLVYLFLPTGCLLSLGNSSQGFQVSMLAIIRLAAPVLMSSGLLVGAWNPISQHCSDDEIPPLIWDPGSPLP